MQCFCWCFFLFSLLLRADFYASPSNPRHHSNDRLSIKFQFGKERVYVIDFIFPTQHPFAFLRNECSLSPTSIVKFVKRCFLSLREIASPILFDRSPFSFLKDADTSLFQGRKRCESDFFFSLQHHRRRSAFLQGEEDTPLQFRFTCTNKNFCLKKCVALLFPLIAALLHDGPSHCSSCFLNHPSS